MIKEKLDILVSSDIIDEDTKEYVLKVLDYLLTNQIIEVISQADVFLTHLAMADTRRKQNESVASLDEFILSELLAAPKYTHSKQLWKDLQNMTEKKFDDAELDYFYLHIINLLKED